MLTSIIASLARLAQEPASPAKNCDPAFEIASIKRSVPGQMRNGFGCGKRMLSEPGFLRMRNVEVEELLMYAFDIQNAARLSGIPDLPDRYDIDAKTPAPSTEQEEKHMLQALLKERFHLVYHHENKSAKGLALILGKGFRLEKSEGNDGSIRMNADPTHSALTYDAKNVTMAMLAGWLSGHTPLGEVVDQTGNTDTYNFVLRFPYATSTPSDPSSPGARSIQMDENSYVLGLKKIGLDVKRQQVTVDQLVIDRMDKPVVD